MKVFYATTSRQTRSKGIKDLEMALSSNNKWKWKWEWNDNKKKCRSFFFITESFVSTLAFMQYFSCSCIKNVSHYIVARTQQSQESRGDNHTFVFSLVAIRLCRENSLGWFVMNVMIMMTEKESMLNQERLA